MPVRRQFSRSLFAVALVVTVCSTAPRPAWAAEPPTEADLTQARERFAAARKLEDAGRWAEALTLFQRIAAVKMTPQVRFHVALCLEHVGLWTQAIDGYTQAASEAGASAPDVVREANEHRRALEETTPTVSVRAEGFAPGDELYLDQRRVPVEDRPPSIRVDPGPHTAEVRRGETILARELFVLEPRGTRRVELRPGSAALPAGGAATPAPPGAPSDGRALRIAGWSAIGVGAASTVLAGVFIGLRAGALSRLEAQCPSRTGCGPVVRDIVSDGKTDATLVNVFGALGIVAAATGVTLLLVAPSPPPDGAAPAPPGAVTRLDLAPYVGPSAAGFIARGVF